ncbi:hypothetical protein GmHk_19G055152 [Glycine max]|nr:hypothetical protein GmHk_19G055152 [Glycine max]
MIPTDKGIVFECLTDPKVILITEDMLFASLRKAIFDAKRRLQNFNKCFLLSTKLQYNSKGPIELNATFGHSREEILA